MKRVKQLLMGLMCFVVLFTLTGCGNKTAITSDDFKSKMESSGYTVQEATNQMSDYDYIKQVYIAISSDSTYQIEFYELSDNSDDFNGYDKLELMSVFDNTLNDEDKIFFYLKYIYGFTSLEIAQLYNVKDTYVRKRLQYCKEKLKKALQ